MQILVTVAKSIKMNGMFVFFNNYGLLRCPFANITVAT